MFVYLLTEEQKELIVNQTFTQDSYFNPVQDYFYNWIISKEEVEQCIVEEFMWVKDLPEIEYIAPEPAPSGSL